MRKVVCCFNFRSVPYVKRIEFYKEKLIMLVDIGRWEMAGTGCRTRLSLPFHLMGL